MSNQPIESQASDQLSEILSKLSTLSEQVARLEEKLMVVTDVDRYGKLQEFLAAGKFKEADAETTNVILEFAGKERDNFSPEDIQKFPCSALRVIDRLWSNYSQGRFAFNLQLKLYLDSGGDLDALRAQDTKALSKFAESVGWLVNGEVQFPKYDSWDFTLSAPKGCFPADAWRSPYGLKMVTFLFRRLIYCDL